MPNSQNRQTATLVRPAIERASVQAKAPQPPRVLVWDRLVRGFHWLLVSAITTAAVTGFLIGARAIDIHVWAGVMAAALVLGRLVWGLFGPTHARFTDFPASPAKLLAHARALFTGRAERHRGHNPLGGGMIVALLLLIAALTITGTVAFGGVLKAGPLAFLTSFAVGWQTREIHQLLAIVLLGLIGLHIAGALFESHRTHENLLRAMIDGRKEARPLDHVSRPQPARPRLAAAIATTLLVATGAIVWALALRPGLGVPIALVDPVYTEECGACHTAYHPSLLPAASWSTLVAGLGDHFDENASLDATTSSHIRDYLLANAAETADTLPANRLRRVDAKKPLSITATPFWTRRHANLPDTVFASKAVGTRGNCVACHADARIGRFYPGAIEIPEKAKP